MVGASVSIWHGVSELIGGEQTQGRDYALAYAVLAIAFVLEGISFLRAARQLRAEAQRLDRDLLTHALETSDPTVRAVFAEDASALIETPKRSILDRPRSTTGVWSWFTTIDHKKVGILYGVSAFIFFIVGGSEAGNLCGGCGHGDALGSREQTSSYRLVRGKLSVQTFAGHVT